MVTEFIRLTPLVVQLFFVYFTFTQFTALQVGIVARVLSALIPAAATPLTLLAVQFWIAAVGAWALRYGRWLLKPRADGQPG